jgi:hypothetical protein
MMIKCLYLSHIIRGNEGEQASEYVQKENLRLARAHAVTLRRACPEIKWMCPHENDLINEAIFCGAADGDDIVDMECEMIRKSDNIDGVVVVGKWIPDSGCGQEALAAHDSDKFLCFMDDSDDDSLEHLAERMAAWESE